jgi:RNA polymerase sigma-70 factor (ECF subfamily)
LEASDLELVRCAGGGDERAFQDLMQETFVGAYRGLNNFAARSSVKTWLLQILTRQAAKAWHKSRHSRSTLSIHGYGSDEEDGRRANDELAVAARDGTAAEVERKIDVMDVLKTLSAPHREVLVLREIRGLSYEEIADVLGTPRGTVESRLSRARAEFRQKYEGKLGAAKSPGKALGKSRGEES